VAELVGLKVDVIYAEGSVAAARAAKEATTTIPIVVTSPADLVQTGLVASLARPGTNVTGVGGDIRQTKRLQLLKEAVPSATRIAVLWNPTNPAHEPALKETKGAARTLGVQLQPVKASRPEEIAGAFLAMARERAKALFVIGDAMLYQELPRIVALAAQGRLPAMYIWRRAVEVGGLMAYREDRSSDPRLAAVYIDRILKGAKVAELPVELPARFKFSVNLKTAKALGLTIPQSVLLRADEVIQ
jgi:putative tryptophan/tyrosine transport system substrate-binding protein